MTLVLNRIDERILAELDNDARQTNAQIAKKLHVNKNVVNYRIRKLEHSGVIQGYYAIIDTYLLGYSSYRVYLKLQYGDPQKEKEIMDYLIDLPQTWWLGHIKGKFNMAALFWVKTQKEFLDLWLAFAKKYKQNIKESVVMVYHGLEHYRLPFSKRVLGEWAKIESIGVVDNIVAVDAVDIKILQFLASNARSSLLEIANVLKLTPAAIKYRIIQLTKKKIILGYRAIINMNALGYTLYKININLWDLGAYDKMQRFAQTHPDIFYLDKTIGWTDIEIEAYAQNPQRFYEILDEIRTKFSDSIRDEDFFSIPVITKIQYMPKNP